MSKITVEHAREGGRAKAKAGERILPDAPTFKSPFDVLKPGYKRDESQKVERTVTNHGTVRVRFTEKQKTVSRSAAADVARAPKFDLAGDHSLPLDAAERLNALPGHRHGSK